MSSCLTFLTQFVDNCGDARRKGGEPPEVPNLGNCLMRTIVMVPLR